MTGTPVAGWSPSYPNGRFQALNAPEDQELDQTFTERSGNLLYPVNQDFPSIGVPLGPEDREVLLGYTAGGTQLAP